MRMIRPLFVLLHRWFGLTAAFFLFVAGITGAIISWDHELDAWLNPHLFYAQSAHQLSSESLSGLALANLVEKKNKQLRVTYVLTENETGHTNMMMVGGRIDSRTGQPFTPGFNQIAVNPFTGEIQGQRQWGALSGSRESLIPFLYKLHYTLFIPEMGGIELGIWVMGIIALVWAVDCFIALFLSFPHWRSWRKSFAFRWRQGGHKFNFDLHRSGGVWLWTLLFMLAVTAISMNLERQVVRPVVSLFSTLTPDVFDARRSDASSYGEPGYSREQVIKLAEEYAVQRDWKMPIGGIFYSPDFNIYGVGFFKAGNDHGDAGLGNTWLYFNAKTGELAGAKIPGTGSAGEVFLQAQFPLHSGRILGLPGRILISLLGLAVAILSLTGVMIWVRKRKAKQIALRKNNTNVVIKCG